MRYRPVHQRLGRNHVAVFFAQPSADFSGASLNVPACYSLQARYEFASSQSRKAGVISNPKTYEALAPKWLVGENRADQRGATCL